MCEQHLIWSVLQGVNWLLLIMWCCRSGEVYSWGINDYGQLGDGTTDYATVPVRAVGLDDVKIADISAAGWHSLAITDDGGEHLQSPWQAAAP